jgi:hypothetical protein
MIGKITVNGREYGSIEEMPPDVREQYRRAMSLLADRDGNGVPDVLDGGKVNISSATGEGAVTSFVRTTERYVINGHEYDRLEDIPAEMRDVLRRSGAAPGSRPAGHSGITLSAGVNSDRRPLGSAGASRGLTIHITWSTALAAVTATAIVVWLLTR